MSDDVNSAAELKNSLSEAEQTLFDLILDKKFDVARNLLLNDPSIRATCVDKDGTSLLQQAAFRGTYSTILNSTLYACPDMRLLTVRCEAKHGKVSSGGCRVHHKLYFNLPT